MKIEYLLKRLEPIAIGDFSTMLGIWVYGDICLSARDMASPNE
jgi:hypothetical protein